jgi:hypothetical protein
VKDDLGQLVSMTAKIRNVKRRKVMEESIKEIEGVLRKSGLLETDPTGSELHSLQNS